jgi:hypothetical protein
MASDFDVHRASTTRRERLPRCLETESLPGLTGLQFDVHPASTARSSASASRSLDPAALWTGFQWRRLKLRKSRWPPRVFGNSSGLSSRGGSWSSASSAIACSGTARLLSRVLVCLTRPFAYARRIWTTPAARSTSPCSSANNSEGRSPVAAGLRARGEGLTRSLRAGAAVYAQVAGRHRESLVSLRVQDRF